MTSILEDIDTTAMGNAKIKVIGVGGAGGNAVQEMISSNLIGVQFICANTDLQALGKNNAPVKVQLGEKLTRGLGAGANPDIGREAAHESINALRDAIGEQTDMVFVTAGMGGGTGTGAAPVVAATARELGALTVGVVSKPFTFEGQRRMRTAEKGLEELAKNVDSLIIIPNDRLCSLAPKKTPVPEMFKRANEILLNAVRGISDVIMREGSINLDFADVRTTMAETGLALMGTGRASGENRAREATQQAIMSPFLEDVSLESAKAILYNITANHEFTMEEMSEIGFLIHEAAGNDPDINIIYGVVYDDSLEDEVQVTVIATGIEPSACAEPDEPAPMPANVRPFQPKLNNGQQAQPPRNMQKVEPEYNQQPIEPEMQRQERRVAGDNWYDDGLQRYSYNRPGTTRNRHMPGKDSLAFDKDDLDIPAFLRPLAD